MVDTTAPETAKKRGPGRPRGLGKVPGSGRKPGTPNKDRAITRDFIIKHGAPIAFLCSVVKGRRFTSAKEPGDAKRTHVFPTVDQRLRAAEILSKKVLPDLRSTELTGKDGGPVALTLLDFLRELPE